MKNGTGEDRQTPGAGPLKAIASVGMWGVQIPLRPLPLLQQLRERCFAKNSIRL